MVRNGNPDGRSVARIHGIEIRRVTASEEIEEQLRAFGPIGRAAPHGGSVVQPFGPQVLLPQFQPVVIETNEQERSNAAAFALTMPLELSGAGEPRVVVDLEIDAGALGLGCTTADYSSYVDREVFVPAGVRRKVYVPVGRPGAACHLMVRNGNPDGRSVARIHRIEFRRVTAPPPKSQPYFGAKVLLRASEQSQTSNVRATQPTFSVIVSTYNRSNFIIPTIQSVLAQTFPPLEILVIGDGCTDDTGEVLRTHFSERVKWHNLNANGGSQSYPNNEGLRRARGSHVAYLGHDDVWAPEHLSLICDVISREDPDFVVSGAIYYQPPGAGPPWVTGLVINEADSAQDFYPPSSFVHRHPLMNEWGGWPDPNSIRLPVDAHVIASARKLGLSFASTGAITVHKFAAGARYLNYLFPSADEQNAILRLLTEPAAENRLLSRIIAESMSGLPPVRVFIPPEREVGAWYRRSRAARGLDAIPAINLDAPRQFTPEDGPAALDWHPLEMDSLGRPFRWSGPNPNPLWFVNVRCPGRVAFSIHILGFAEPSFDVQSLGIEINDRPVKVDIKQHEDYFTFNGVSPPGPITHGLKFLFHVPQIAKLRDESRGYAGFQLHRIDLIPEEDE